MHFSRYAVYVTLPQGPLSDFGAAWLGWNAATGERPDAPVVHGLPLPAHEITATPRKYGLHGTIKPPFRLVEGMDFDALHDGFARFCATQAPVTLDGLALTRLGRFLALTPVGETGALSTLAARTVEALDPFRAPLTKAELDKRRTSGLNDRQEALLTRWGYPYVMDQFRFHITLSGKLDRDMAEQVRSALLPHIEPHLPSPFTVEALTLCGEDSTGYFHELHRYALSG
jgi:putative phosphonate metabolism protein